MSKTLLIRQQHFGELYAALQGEVVRRMAAVTRDAYFQGVWVQRWPGRAGSPLLSSLLRCCNAERTRHAWGHRHAARRSPPAATLPACPPCRRPCVPMPPRLPLPPLPLQMRTTTLAPKPSPTSCTPPPSRAHSPTLLCCTRWRKRWGGRWRNSSRRLVGGVGRRWEELAEVGVIGRRWERLRGVRLPAPQAALWLAVAACLASPSPLSSPLSSSPRLAVCCHRFFAIDTW